MDRGVFLMLKRTVILFFIFCFVIGILFTRLAVIEEGGVNFASISGHSISKIVAQSRGMIYDCNLRPLVNAQNSNYIAVKPSLSSFERINDIVPYELKNGLLAEISHGRIGTFKSNTAILSADATSFSAVERYFDNGICVHTIGYVNSELEGVSGIEKYYNEMLNNNGGTLKAICEIDARQNVLEGEKIKFEGDNYNSKAGIELTIDKETQEITENALERFNISKGAIVILDVKTSEIRAIASVPEFSQNDIAKSLNANNSPFINRAITPYSVGSIFKVVVSASALENGIKTDFSYTCNGKIKLGNQVFNCHKKSGHGVLDMNSGMAQSCNPYFISLAQKTGENAICSMARNLGLGKEIELCDGWYSPSGNMPKEEDIVSPQDLANLAFGQGELLASPLQMAAVYCAIANDGIYRAPSLMKAIVNENRVEIMKAQLPASRRAMSEKTAQTVKSLLLNTVEAGSGKRAKPENMRVAGKTATAQSGEFDENKNEITRSWFCGFFPYDEPKYSVAILKENGEGGSKDCAPVFKFIAENVK